MSKINYKLINFTFFLLIIFLIYYLFSYFFVGLKPILISFSIAYILNPILTILNKKINSRILSVFIIFILLFIFIIGIGYFSFPILVKQYCSLTNDLIPFINKIFLNDFFGLKDVILNLISNISNTINNNYFLIINKSFSFISNLFIILLLSFVFLLKMEKIKLYIKKILKKKKDLQLLLKKIDSALNNYLKALLIIIFIEIFEYTFIYLIIGHPNFLLIGVLAGITTIIPYFGALFTNILALITAAFISPKLFIICALIVIVVPIFDNYVIDPKIYQRTNKISPFKAVLAIIVCGMIFGSIGFIIAIPILIIIETIIKNKERLQNL